MGRKIYGLQYTEYKLTKRGSQVLHNNLLGNMFKDFGRANVRLAGEAILMCRTKEWEEQSHDANCALFVKKGTTNLFAKIQIVRFILEDYRR